MAMAVEATVATNVADTARGRPRLSLRPTPSSMEDTMATLLPSPMPAMLIPPPTPMAPLPMPLPTLMVATDVADMARGRPRLSLRPTPSSMEDTMATLLPSPTPAMLMPPPTPMALLPMALPTLLVATPTSGRG